MINSEILEIKKQFRHENSSITKVSGCYVDGEKVIKTKFTETFLCLPEEETFKYFEIFKKTLSGSIGKNLINMEFKSPARGEQEYLILLRDSELKDENLLDNFYEKVIQSYDYVGSYLILIVYAAYDVPGKTKDKLQMDDASEEVYRYILCSICPVKLSKPGLSYHEDVNQIHKRIQDWVVNEPISGFLYPAFNNRSADIDYLLYYSKDSENMHNDFIDQILGSRIPVSAEKQKDVLQSLIQETIADIQGYEIVREIYEKINENIEDHKIKEIPEPLTMDAEILKEIFEESGVSDEKLEDFKQNYEKLVGENTVLLAENIINRRKFEIKTPDIVIKVNPEKTDLVKTKEIDGRKCFVIEVNDQVEVNGIMINT
jgi:hypothetical protein